MGIWALTLKTPASDFFPLFKLSFPPVRAEPVEALFCFDQWGSLLGSGAALSPQRASHFLLLRQKKVTQKKATPVPASLRFAAGNLRCSAQPGSRSNSLRSDNRGPCSVWASAPRRIHKGFGRDEFEIGIGRSFGLRSKCHSEVPLSYESLRRSIPWQQLQK
jgi:hypothetical protein